MHGAARSGVHPCQRGALDNEHDIPSGILRFIARISDDRISAMEGLPHDSEVVATRHTVYDMETDRCRSVATNRIVPNCTLCDLRRNAVRTNVYPTQYRSTLVSFWRSK